MDKIGCWKNCQLEKGQSLFEVLFSIAIAALVMGAIVSLATVAVRNSSYARSKTLATRYLQQTSEWLREQRDASWADFYSKAGNFYCLKNISGWPGKGKCGSTDFITGTIFVREVELQTSGTDTVVAEITVEWSDAKGLHTVNSIARYTDWRR